MRCIGRVGITRPDQMARVRSRSRLFSNHRYVDGAWNIDRVVGLVRKVHVPPGRVNEHADDRKRSRLFHGDGIAVALEAGPETGIDRVYDTSRRLGQIERLGLLIPFKLDLRMPA